MRLVRLLCTLPLVTAIGCLSTPAPHERALLNNELCAQQLSINDLERAEVYCDLGLEFSPQYADLWVNKGLIKLKYGKMDEAKNLFIKALRYNQEQAQAYQNLGFIYLQEGSYGKAHDNFQRALKVNPDYLEARYNLALTYMKLDKIPEARKEFNTIIAVNPNIADAHHSLGAIAYEQGKYEEAAEHIARAVQLSPDVPTFWHDYGATLMELSRFTEAKDAFGSCVNLDPKNPQCLNNLAIAQRKAALTDSALKELKDTQTAENTAPSLYVLGKQYNGQGLVAEEERTYKKCLRLDGKYAPCHYGLFEIYKEAQKKDAATIACKNFLKYGSAEEFPTETQTCEKFLADDSF
ncbi:tetratricopeptide repeat protein [Hyalangium rubrum]|uniref:Tetratricopeptide repeat protein n=1 Tax=Hyalangium rubrum TaxID=3103134 RepID=A0ABU5GWF3_9BACT|nr:tetratricopeptide repeat protein [Hyalangium sp. s54d21]MDY7225510.1 tetratricopeptide repeat protein [Hyalangium sp. s54d21]